MHWVIPQQWVWIDSDMYTSPVVLQNPICALKINELAACMCCRDGLQAANLPDYIPLPKLFVDWIPIVLVIRSLCVVLELSQTFDHPTIGTWTGKVIIWYRSHQIRIQRKTLPHLYSVLLLMFTEKDHIQYHRSMSSISVDIMCTKVIYIDHYMSSCVI